MADTVSQAHFAARRKALEKCERSCFFVIMTKGTATKRTIVEAGLGQARVEGLESVSIGPLAKSLAMSKSGLFRHFDSREAMQLAIAERARELFVGQVVRPGAAAATASARLRQTFSLYLDWIVGTHEDGGCLFVSMAQDYDDRPGALRDWLVAVQEEWRRHLGGLVEAVVAEKRLPPHTDVMLTVFELMGIALSFRHSSRLHGDPAARAMADAAFSRLIEPRG